MKRRLQNRAFNMGYCYLLFTTDTLNRMNSRIILA